MPGRQYHPEDRADNLTSRLSRYSGALLAISWPWIAFTFNDRSWIVPASLIVYAVVIVSTQSGAVLPFAIAGLAIGAFLQMNFAPTTRMLRGSDLARSLGGLELARIVWQIGFCIVGLLVGAIFGIATDLGNRPQNSFASSAIPRKGGPGIT